MKDITKRYDDLNPEDTVFETDDGLVIKVKAHENHAQPGFIAVKLTASVCDPATAKALDHKAGPGGKFICLSRNWTHQDHSEGDVSAIFRAQLEACAEAGATAWRHHQGYKTLPIATRIGAAHIHVSPFQPLPVAAAAEAAAPPDGSRKPRARRAGATQRQR